MTIPGTPPSRTPAAAPHRLAREVTGVAMVLAGSLMLFGLVVISNSPARGAERLLFALGLATTSLISAGAQFLVFAGLAVLWGARRRR